MQGAFLVLTRPFLLPIFLFVRGSVRTKPSNCKLEIKWKACRPVPVPISRILRGLTRGERWSSLFSLRTTPLVKNTFLVGNLQYKLTISTSFGERYPYDLVLAAERDARCMLVTNISTCTPVAQMGAICNVPDHWAAPSSHLGTHGNVCCAQNDNCLF